MPVGDFVGWLLLCYTLSVLKLKNGKEITLGGLTAWDSIEIEKELGKPISDLNDAGMQGLCVIGWRMAKNGGFAGSFEDFCKELDLQDDVKALGEAVADFFG